MPLSDMGDPVGKGPVVENYSVVTKEKLQYYHGTGNAN